MRRKFDEARKAQPSESSTGGHARVGLKMIRELYLIERALWDRDQPITPEHRMRVRAEPSAPIVARFHAWCEALAPQVLPQSLLGKAVLYALGQWRKLIVFLEHAGTWQACHVPANRQRAARRSRWKSASIRMRENLGMDPALLSTA